MMKRPNVLFILIDDMGWRDTGCYGSTFYETPNIDRLATNGMRFTNGYAACPVCSPTRASIMTGKYPATVGITDWIDWFGHIHPARGRLIDVPYLKQLPLSEYTLAQALKDQGYATWHVGKWHLGAEGHAPEQFGFDVNIGGCMAGSPGEGGYFSPWTIPALKDAKVPEGTYLTDYLSDCAVELIEKKDERPFFLNLWYYSVHIPIQAKEEKIRKYQKKAKDLGLDQIPPFEEGSPFPTEHKKHLHIQRRRLQSDPVYAAMIESLDEGIGKVLDALERSGEMNNTIIVFTSDNGGLATSEGSPTCNAPLSEGKGWMYEGGTRVPLLFQWQGIIPPGSVCETPVSSTDFYPTLLEALDLPLLPHQHVDGTSFLPLLKKREGSLDNKEYSRPPLFWHYPHYGNQGGTPGASIRMGDYKLIIFFEDSHLELYNLRNDIGEDHNLIEEEPELAEQMRKLLLEWQLKVEAKIPQPNPGWKPEASDDHHP